jgi:hypothetical protein
MTSRTSKAADSAVKTLASAGSPRRFITPVVPYAALLLAIVAIAAAYVTSKRVPPSVPRPPGPVVPAYPAVTLNGAFPLETGPGGTGGQWIGDVASMRLTGISKAWVAFRAVSLRVGRTLTFRDPAGEQATAHIGTEPRVYLIGPLSEGVYALRPTPGGVIPSARDPRHLSVFLSTPRTVSRPLAALPGEGFWPNESVHGVTYNWLRGVGAIDVYALHARADLIWLTFVASSIGSRRTLIAQSGPSAHRVVVPTSSRLIRLGPYRLVHGRARISLHTSPGPSRYRVDPRMLSVWIGRLTAYTSPSEG